MYNWPTPPKTLPAIPRTNAELDSQILSAIELLTAAQKSNSGKVKVQLCKAVSEMLKNVAFK